jgi:hypothetical protein
MCSDCHAGENPFIVHPLDLAFSSALSAVNVNPKAWPTPIVHPDWVGNIGPIEKLGPVNSGQERCDSCHSKDVAGRFPLVSNALPEYCSSVLTPAVSTGATMPPGGGGGSYTEHRDWLLAACGSSPGSGQVGGLNPPPWPGVLSPPIIEEPLYACASKVVVTGASVGATVVLYDGNNLYSKVVNDLHTEFTLSSPQLTAGQIVSATQVVGGVKSDPSTALVRDHFEDYSDGLPAPTIVPETVYECATAIAVHNVPGVRLMLEKIPVTGQPTGHELSTGVHHTWFGGLGPSFDQGDRFRVRQALCGDVSDSSDEVEATSAPASLPSLVFKPPELTIGQPLITLESIVQGSGITVEEQTAGLLVSEESVPYTWWPGIDIATPLGSGIQAQHSLVATQELCSMASTPSSPPPVQSCSIPEIAQPIEGDTFVLVTQGAPGMTLRIFDATDEIGSGAGYVVALTRALLAGEVIAVVHEMPLCSAPMAYFIDVHEL